MSAPYYPEPGDRVRVVAVCPSDSSPRHAAGDITTAGPGSGEGACKCVPRCAYLCLPFGFGTWCTVERAALPADPPPVTHGISEGPSWADVPAERVDGLLDSTGAVAVTGAELRRVRDSATRKGQPIATGVLAYWPKTMAALSENSRRGNDKHNPGEPLHWAREKSTDEADCCVRHIVDALEADKNGAPGGVLELNEDGTPHLIAALWRLASWCERALEGDERWRTVAKSATPHPMQGVPSNPHPIDGSDTSKEHV